MVHPSGCCSIESSSGGGGASHNLSIGSISLSSSLLPQSKIYPSECCQKYMKEKGIKMHAQCRTILFFLFYFSFFVYVRYEFSDMAKRGERVSPPSYSVASVVFVNKLSIAPPPPFSSWCGADGRLPRVARRASITSTKGPRKNFSPSRGKEEEEWHRGRRFNTHQRGTP